MGCGVGWLQRKRCALPLPVMPRTHLSPPPHRLPAFPRMQWQSRLQLDAPRMHADAALVDDADDTGTAAAPTPSLAIPGRRRHGLGAAASASVGWSSGSLESVAARATMTRTRRTTADEDAADMAVPGPAVQRLLPPHWPPRRSALT